MRVRHLVANAAITLLLRVTLQLIATHHVKVVRVVNGTGFDLARFPIKGGMALDAEHLVAPRHFLDTHRALRTSAEVGGLEEFERGQGVGVADMIGVGFGANTDAALAAAIVVAGLAKAGGTEEAFAVGVVAADGVVVDGLERDAALLVDGGSSFGAVVHLHAEIAEAEFSGMELFAFGRGYGGQFLVLAAESADLLFMAFNVDKAFDVRHEERLAGTFAANELFFDMFAHVTGEKVLREMVVEKDIGPVGIAAGAARVGTFGHDQGVFGTGLAHFEGTGLAFALYQMRAVNVFIRANAALKLGGNYENEDSKLLSCCYL